jgi:hypothetical protein
MDTAMKNEVYCKFVAHNVCCVIISQVELGIEPMFWGEQTAGAEPIKTDISIVPVAVVGAAPAAEEKKPFAAPRGMMSAGA